MNVLVRRPSTRAVMAAPAIGAEFASSVTVPLIQAFTGFGARLRLYQRTPVPTYTG